MPVAVVGPCGVPQSGGDGLRYCGATGLTRAGGDGLRYCGATGLTRAGGRGGRAGSDRGAGCPAVTVAVAVAVGRWFGNAALGAVPVRERRCGTRSGFVRWPDARPGGRFGGRRLGGAGRAVGRGLVRHGVRETRGEA
ncbi:hypothetical protein [Streptomyces exfoliatus]|uniref:hypothetical protein n=1 Tax=Streptomyces exfoliatus TaxID=1905 RepID=UPI00379BFD71